MIVNPNKVLSEMITEGRDSCQVQQNGIDLTVKGVLILIGTGSEHPPRTVSPCEREIGARAPHSGEHYQIEPGQTAEIYFEQGVSIPANACAWIVGRSSFARAGVQMWSGLWDSGFRTDSCGCMLHNTSPNIVSFKKGDRLAQLIVAEADSASQYQGHWNGK